MYNFRINVPKLELEQEKLEEQMKELKKKKKQTIQQVDPSIVNPESCSDDDSSETMDKNNLLLYSINHEKDLDSMTDEVQGPL